MYSKRKTFSSKLCTFGSKLLDKQKISDRLKFRGGGRAATAFVFATTPLCSTTPKQVGNFRSNGIVSYMFQSRPALENSQR